MLQIQKDDSAAFKTSIIAAFILHALLLTAVVLTGSLASKSDNVEVRFIRLRGGGENRPGWMKPATMPSDDAKISDGKPAEIIPKPVSKPIPEPVKEVAEKKESAPPEKPLAVEPEPEKSLAVPVEEVKKVETEYESVPLEADLTQPGETGLGVGAKPGPEGPGFGATTEVDFPGGEVYIGRLEVEVQRRFNFRGRGTGVFVEYHFYIAKTGKVRDLVLMKSSGISSLDLSARSAISRSKFPPLPGTYDKDKLGITYRFYDDK